MKYKDLMGFSKKKSTKKVVVKEKKISIYDELKQEFGSLRSNRTNIISEGPSYEYRKDIKNIDKSYKLHAKSVLDLYEKLRKKGLDDQASDLLDSYKKNIIKFKKEYDKILRKLL